MTIRGLTIAVAFVVAASAAQAAPAMDVQLKPVRDGAEVAAIAVTVEVRDGSAAEAQAFVLTAPVTYAGVPGIADRVRDLVVRDAAGEVPLAFTDDPAHPGGFPNFRHWTAQRPVSFPLTYSYRALVQPTGARNGPPFGIRPAGGSVSGSGAGFMVVPERETPSDLKVAWNLSGLAEGSVGASSFGDGAFAMTAPPAQLLQGWFMAGPLGRTPATHDFAAYWMGKPPFDPAAEMTWTAGMRGYLVKSFGYLKPPPKYRVFMRFLDTPPFGGGTALENSFMLSRAAEPPLTDRRDLRVTFTHEMTHQFVGGIDGPIGVTSWFAEGLTVYYTSKLMFRGGFTDLDGYVASVAEMTDGYWGSPAWTWTADAIVKAGFGDEKIRHVPYNRSALYFADLDSRIRAASGGKRTLDDLVRDMFLRREAGEAFDQDKWIALVEKEIGPSARKTFEAVILRGEPLTPAADAFGPCLERRARVRVVNGVEVAGYEWVKAPGASASRCEQW